MEASVTDRAYYRKQDELDRLLNDPRVARDLGAGQTGDQEP